MRVHRPREGRLPALLFLHGGGFVLDRTGYEAPLREQALAGDRVPPAFQVLIYPMLDATAGLPSYVESSTASSR